MFCHQLHPSKIQAADMADGCCYNCGEHPGYAGNNARHTLCQVTSLLSYASFISVFCGACRSTVLYPWLHVAAPYYLVDTYAMTAAYMKREEVARRRRLRTKLVLFLRDKWPYLLHHVFIAIGYPVIVVRSLICQCWLQCETCDCLFRMIISGGTREISMLQLFLVRT